MNHACRIIWSEVRQAFIVVSETARSRGKSKSVKKTALAQAIASAILALSGGAAFADSCSADTIISANTTDACVLDTGASLTVNQGVTLDGSSSASAILVDTGVTANSISIAGASVLGDVLINGALNEATDIALKVQGSIGAAAEIVGDIVINGAVHASGGAAVNLSQYSTLTGSLFNNGSITTSIQAAVALADNSEITGDFVNGINGEIIGKSLGLYVSNASIDGAVINSGTISSSLIAGIGISETGGLVSAITNNDGGYIGGVNAYYGIDLWRDGSVTGKVTNAGMIQGASTGLLIEAGSSIGGGLVNSGTIQGDNSVGIYLTSSSISGGLNNSGLIQGGSTGIKLDYASTISSLTNSGTISGDNYAINVADVNSSIGSIVIAGNNTAKFIGDVQATRTPVTVKSGATYTMDNGHQFAVSTFTVSGGANLVIGAGDTADIVGDFSVAPTGGFVVGVDSSTVHGRLVVGSDDPLHGNAALNGFVGVMLNQGATISSGDILTGVLVSTGTLSGTPSIVDNSVLWDFTGAITSITNGNSFDLTAVASNSSCGSAGVLTGSVTLSCEIGYDSPSLTVEAGGSITTSGAHGIIALQNMTANDVAGIVNHGAVTASGSNAAAIWVDHTHVENGIVNSGQLVAAVSAGIFVRNATVGTGITNTGSIDAHWVGIYGQNANLQGGIVNGSASDPTATISGDSYGIQLTAGSVVTSITNHGEIRGGSSGIFLTQGSSVTAGIDNAGSIIGGYSDAIRIKSSSVAGGLSNSGTIEGVGVGLRLSHASTLSGNLSNSGSIVGSTWHGIALLNSAVNGALINSGRIQGATYAVYVDATSTLSDIHITGDDTAEFVGVVFAENTAVTVDSGATYTMNAGQVFTLTNSGFTNSGTLAVAAGATGTITGGYAQDSTATFRVNVASDTSYGKLNVSGTAALPSATKIDVNVVGSPTLTVGTTLAGVISAGSLTGADSFSVTDNSVLFNFSAVKSGNDIDLTIEKGLAVREANTRAGNVAGDGAARSLDAVINDAALGASAQWTPIITALGEMSSEAAVANAVSQTLPLLTGDGQVASSAALSGISRVVQARQEANRGLSSGDKFYGDKNFWMKPFGSWADQDDRQGVSGYKAHTSGLAFGVDGTVSDKTRLGGAFAYAKANTTGNSSSAPHSAKVDVYQLVGYGSRALDKDTEVNFQVGLGQNQNRGSRTLDTFGLVAQADYRSLTATAGVGVGRTYKQSETTSFTPTLRADYAWIKDEGYTETGANALNLIVNDRSTEELVLSVDGKLTHALSSGATFSGHLGLGYDALSGQTSITSAFAGAPTTSFTTKGLNPSPWMLRGGVGYTQTMQSGMEVSARYDLEYRDSFLNQTASVKLRWAF